MFHFTINHTKKVGYELKNVKVFTFDGYEMSPNFDPLHILVRLSGRYTPGRWVGDAIGVSDELPAGYKLLDEVWIDL